MLRTQCCGHIVADTNVSPVCPHAQHLLRTQNLCPRHKNVSDFFQKQFVSATNVSRFAQHRNNHEQQRCVLVCHHLKSNWKSRLVLSKMVSFQNKLWRQINFIFFYIILYSAQYVVSLVNCWGYDAKYNNCPSSFRRKPEM